MVLSGLFRRHDEANDGNKDKLAGIVLSREQNIAPQHIQDLCASVGWARREPDLIARALANSLVVVSAWDGNLIVGFGRATGDRVFNATIWDVAVRPNYQHIGIGRMIMGELVKVLDSYHIPLITLYADYGREHFYKHFGFAADPLGARAMFREKG